MRVAQVACSGEAGEIWTRKCADGGDLTMTTRNRNIAAGAFWTLTAILFAGLTVMVFTWTPVEATMGPVQKIFYLHLPVAINTFVAAMVVFIASVGYLATRKMWWDDLAMAAAKATVLLCTIVLLTGMIWGKSAWGQWWTWSPRLTFSLLLWLLYVVYMVIRTSVDSPQRRAMICAVYGIVAFLDVPLVHLSTRMLPDIHPTSIELADPMKTTLLVYFLPVTLMTFGMIRLRYVLNVRSRHKRQQQLEAYDAAADGLA